MLEILFVKSNKIGSKIIRAVTSEPVSHCAIKFEDLVFHSTMINGVHVDFYKDFIDTHEILFNIKIGSDLAKLSNIKHSRYDYFGILYLGLKLLLGKIGIKLPKKNLWQSTGMYMCTEFISEIVNDKEDSMITPYKLYKKLSEKG